jgi:tetratricopeptide (TPR) repeat protein
VVAIDLERIFIRRRDQIHIMDTAVQAWKHQVAVPTYQSHAVSGQYPCIVWLSGSGGLGKSTLLKHYREELVASEPLLHVGEIIDWLHVLNDDNRLRHFMVNDVYEKLYFEMMYQQLSLSIDRRLHNFKEYKRNINLLQDIEDKVSKILENVQKIAECNTLWKIPKVRMLKLLQWFVRSGLYEQDTRETARKLKEYTSEGVNIEVACIYRLHEELSRKLGDRFNDYLRSGNMLGTALGHDLQRFARDRPLLIFFDTYECVEKGNDLLRSIIEAAGIRVGWFIAGRSQSWASGSLPDFTNNKIYKPNTMQSDSIVSIHLKAEEAGNFSPEDITCYFLQLCEQKQSLPAITKQDAQRIYYVTQGIPLAVSIAAQFYAQTGKLDTLLDEGDGTRNIVEGMVERYLLYVPKEERILLYGLAMLRRIGDSWVVDQLVGGNADQEKPLEAQFRMFLHTAHTVSIERGQVSLHQEIRHFLRQWLLENRARSEKQEAAQRLQALLQMRIDDIEKSCPYQSLDQRFEENVWVNAYLDLIETYFWIGNNHGLYHCLPFMLGSVIYRRSLLDDTIAMGNFFRGSMTLLHRKQWDSMVRGLRCDLSMAVADAEQSLEQVEQLLVEMAPKIPSPFIGWRSELEGAIYWKRAELYRECDRNKAVYWYQEAIRRIEHSKILRNEAAYVYGVISLDLYKQKDYERSLNELSEALRIKFDFADANYSKGNIYNAIGDYKRAITEYQYAIALDDYHISAYINLGNTHLILQRYQEAIAEYNKALALEPTSVTLFSNRAYAYTSLGAYQEALVDYDKAIGLQPDFAGAYTNRGTVYAHLHRYEEALADYNKAYELFPHNIQIAWMALWANLGDQQTLKREEIEALIQLDPDHYLSHVCQSISMALQRRNLSVILEELELAIQMKPEEWDHYFWKGMICCYYQNTIMAQYAFEQAQTVGLPPILLKPLSWLKGVVPQFFEAYAALLLANAGL